MSKAILLIDMDGVVCDWAGRLKTNFEALYPDRKLLPYSEFTEFYLADSHPEEWRNDIKNVAYQKGFYKSLPPIEGAIECLKDMEQNCLDFVDPFICSSPQTNSTDICCHSEKAQWVEEHLGEFWTKRLILTKDKTLIRGHFIFDDKPKIEGIMDPTWAHVVFDQPWNQEIKGTFRFTWMDWVLFREEVLRPNFGSRIVTPSKPGIIITP